MYLSLPILMLLPALALANQRLFARELVPVPCSDQGLQACGNAYNCIPFSETCCPDGSGGCPSGTYCDLAQNGLYRCCPDGETTCNGAGDAITFASIRTRQATFISEVATTSSTSTSTGTTLTIVDTLPTFKPSSTTAIGSTTTLTNLETFPTFGPPSTTSISVYLPSTTSALGTVPPFDPYTLPIQASPSIQSSPSIQPSPSIQIFTGGQPPAAAGPTNLYLLILGLGSFVLALSFV